MSAALTNYCFGLVQPPEGEQAGGPALRQTPRAFVAAKSSSLMDLREVAVCSSHFPAPCKERVVMQAEATKVLSFFAYTA